jgi:hypothetical protein
LPSSRWRGTSQPSDDTVLHLQLSCLIKRGRTIRSKAASHVLRFSATDPALVILCVRQLSAGGFGLPKSRLHDLIWSRASTGTLTAAGLKAMRSQI